MACMREQCPEAFLDGLRVSGTHRSMVIRASEGTQQTRNINNSKYLHGLCEQMGGQVGRNLTWGLQPCGSPFVLSTIPLPYLGLGQGVLPSFLEPGLRLIAIQPQGLPVASPRLDACY